MNAYRLPILLTFFLVLAGESAAQTAAGTNLALAKPAAQSTTYQTGVEAAKAVDGNVTSITHTQHNNQAWWQVDLGASHSIGEIKIWNRADCCPERLSNFYILVSDNPFASTDLHTAIGQAGVWNFYVVGQAGWPLTVPVGRTGRHVRVQLAGANWLSLGEVEVYGTASHAPNETVWVEDSVPAGATQGAHSDVWQWVSSAPTPFSGTLAHRSNIVANAMHQHYFLGATQTLAVQSGDLLFAYVYLDPANLPAEVMLQWNDGTWEHRAYWGQDLLAWGTNGTASRRYMGPLPAAGQWVRLEVPASQVGLEGRTLNGMGFTLWGGRATWDRAGKGSPAPSTTGDPNNVALSSNGATVVASSIHSSGYGAQHAIDGRRTGHQWGVNGGWNDATSGSWPDWLEVRFNGAKLIDRVNVFSVQDNYANPVEPAEGQTFSLYGLVNFDVEYWTGASWTPVPNGEISGNNLVRREINFSPVQTDKIRVVVKNALNSWTRITEVEAFQTEFSTLAGQGKCNMPPAKLVEEILAAIENEGNAEAGTLYRERLASDPPPPGEPTGPGRWRRCLNPNFSNWRRNGSQNLPVLAAAIGLFRENSVSSPVPDIGMSNPNDLSRNTKSYAQWWAQFLQYQVGARNPALDGHDFDALRHFKGTELFSNIYDAHTVTAIISARYWAAKNGSHQHAAAIRDHALRYLRANWLIYGLSAGTGPATSYASPNSEGIIRPPNEPLRNNGQQKYNGHFLAMAGSRSNSATWDEGSRAALFDRAIQFSNGESADSNTWRYGVAPSNEYVEQLSLLNYMNERWSMWDSGPKNLYGLERADWIAFRDLIRTGEPTTYFTIAGWLAGIKTVKTIRIVGWSSNGQQRLSTLAGNPNGNNPTIFAVMYEQSNGRATFLYPYTDNRSKGANHKMGGCEISTGAVRANNGGAHIVMVKNPVTNEREPVVVHPFMTARMTIPTQDAKFHLVLSHSADARWETVLPKSFPPPEPQDPSPFDPEGEDPYPPED